MRLLAREDVLPILERDTQDAMRSKSRAASAMKKAKRSDLQLSRYDSAEDSDEEVAMLPEYTPSGQGMGVRRQVRLHFLPRHGSFQLFTDDANVALTLTIEHADGSPVRAHELHVGAKLDVLGRPMTLRSASAKTISWIDSEAKRLLKRREVRACSLATRRPRALAPLLSFAGGADPL